MHFGYCKPAFQDVISMPNIIMILSADKSEEETGRVLLAFKSFRDKGNYISEISSLKKNT